MIRDHQGQFSDQSREAIALELGDVLWYVSQLAHELGYSLEKVAQANLDKLASRAERQVISGSGDQR